MLSLAKVGGSDLEYEALIAAIKTKKTARFVGGVDLSPFKSVKGDLSVHELSPGPVVLLQGVRVVVPGEYRKTGLGALHDYHQSVEAMLLLGKSLVYWPTIKHDFQKVFDRCETCQVNLNFKLPPPPVGNMHFVNLESLDLISLDYCTFAGKSYLVGANHSTEYSFATRTADQTTDSSIRFIQAL